MTLPKENRRRQPAAPTNHQAASIISFDEAIRYANSGVSIIAVGPAKRPYSKWKPYQSRIADAATIRRWCADSRTTGIAAVCGKVSGGRLVLDFDVDGYYEQWCEKVGDRAAGLPVQRTGGGGYQVVLRCDDPGPNQQLAWHPNESEKSGREIAIETRGEGGYAILPGSLHPSGNRYELLAGDFANPPQVAQADVNFLLDAAKSLCQAPRSRQENEKATRATLKSRVGLNGEISVIEQWNRQCPIREILTRNGYVEGGRGEMTRPGADASPGGVVIFDDCEPPRSYHHSTNDVLHDGHAHDSFSILCELEHAGDVKEAVKAAARELGIEKPARNNGSADDWAPTPTEPPWPDSLDEAAFHGPVGQAVRIIEPHTEADPAALLIQLLVAFGNLIGRHVYFVADGARHYANLFAVLVGESSKSRKGTSWNQARRVLAPLDELWIGNRIVAGLSSGEGLIWAVRDPIYKREAVKEKGTPTGEYVEIEADPGVSDKRLLVHEGEYASPLKVVDREGNTLSPVIRNAYDSGKLQSLTKNSPAQATDAHISIIGHITRSELRRRLTETESANGFGNRHLWVCVRRSKILPEGGNLDDAQLADVQRVMNEPATFASKPRRLRRDDGEARAIWHAVYPELSDGKPGLIGAVTSRAEAQVMRLALIYAVLDCSTMILAEHLNAALAVWEYCEQSARHIFGNAIGDPVADELLRALKDAGDEGMTRTEIRDLFKRHKNAKAIGQAIADLFAMGHIRRGKPEETGGRPAEKWYAV